MQNHYIVGERFITLAEFSERYQLSRASIYRLAKSGSITIRKFGRASRISANDADQWAQSLPILGGAR
jgi:excisionase family DNA binding protein